MALICPLCPLMNFPTVSVLMQHIRLTHADKPNFMLQCNLQGCRRSFRKFTTYRNYVYTFHGSGIITERQDVGSNINNNEPEGQHSSSDEMEITPTYDPPGNPL